MATRVVTVFGGSGFIGRHLVRRLARRGWTVRVAVRHPSRAQFLKPMGHVGQIAPLCARVEDPLSVQAALDGAQAAVNLVGILYERGRRSFAAVHARGAQHVAEAAAGAGAEALVQVSAIGADRHAEAEYARSKAAGEAAVRTAFPTATVLRPSIVFGPEDDFFNRFAAMARLSPALPLIGGGRTRFQPVYVGDVAEAIARSLERSEAQGRIYELGGPRVYTFKELMEILLHEIRRRRLLVPLPYGMAELQATFLECLPVPPLTRDQVRLLRHDNVASSDLPGLRELGIDPTALEVVIPTYLDRYRPGGRFNRTVAV